MRKRYLFAMTVFVLMIVHAQASLAQTALFQKMLKKDPKDLVIRVKNTRVADIQELSFLELNFMKNAVYAAKGYRFAKDRPWLTEYFCSENSRGPQIPKSDAAFDGWMNRLRAETAWDLGEYSFPGCREGGDIDENQMKALANIRIALLKKIESLGDIADVNDAFDEEINDTVQTQVMNNTWLWVLGRTISYDSFNLLRDSVFRDIQGYHRLLRLIAHVDMNFDGMELLGLYAGDIIFLKNIIEAKNGKPFDKVLAWEISQLVGVLQIRADYDPKKLPVSVQVKLQMLDEVVKKIMSSDLNDVPASLREKSIDFLTPYQGGAC